MSNEEIILYVLLVVFVVGGIAISFFLVNVMDACAAPGERRRQIDLATKREASKEVHQLILEKLFPPNKVCTL
jgi:flagellar basal body-associated protein FliL